MQNRRSSFHTVGNKKMTCILSPDTATAEFEQINHSVQCPRQSYNKYYFFL